MLCVYRVPVSRYSICTRVLRCRIIVGLLLEIYYSQREIESEIYGISGRGYHGVLEFERVAGQDFSVDLILGVDRAGSRDSLADTVDYSVVAERAHAVLTGEPLDLIETVAERIVDACRDLPGISFMEVAVHKPEAPIAVPFRDVVVRIRREFR